MAPVNRPDLRNVLVLDPAGADGRRIAETVRGAAFVPIEVPTRALVEETIKAGKAAVAMIAVEALGAEPQRILRELKAASPSARFIVVYSSDARRRLLERLWVAGLIDALVSRNTPPHEVNLMLRQAYADALLHGDDGTDDPRLRLLRGTGAAFTGQRRIEGLTRELASRLPAIADFQVLAILVADKDLRLYVQQATAVDHEVLWTLAEEITVAAAPYADSPFGPDELNFMDGGLLDPTSDGQVPTAPLPERIVAVPMVVFGRLVGALGLVLTSPPSAELRTLLQLISYQLSTAIQNIRSIESAEAAALVDELTGAYNRRYLDRVLDSEWRRARRYKLQLSMVLLDIDHFRRLNDLHGHLVGDHVLRAVTSLLRETLRDTDHIVRMETDQFLLLLPETSVRDAALVVERLRMLLSRRAIVVGDAIGKLQITFSAGIVSTPNTNAESAEDLLKSASDALAQAKSGGIDRVCVATNEPPKLDEGGEGEGAEQRRFPRVSSQLRVRYLELPDFESRVVGMSSADVSAGGIKVQGPSNALKKNSYALVFLEDDQKPLLSRVVWTDDADGGDRRAGLEFVRPGELAPNVETAPAISPRALVIVDRVDTRSLVERVLTAARYELTCLDPEHGELERLELSRYSLLIVGESTLRGALGRRIGALREGDRASFRMVVLNETGGRREAMETLATQKVDHLVTHDAASEEALFATLTKLLLGEYFGIKKYLMWGAPTRSWMMTADSNKQRVLDGITQVAQGVHCHPRLIDLLIAAVDEMIINALFHPAKDEKQKRPITVECGSDGRLLAVAVRDEYGHFQTADMFASIGRALEQEQTAIPEGASHASLGFRIMLDALSQLAVNVDPGRCTEIIGIVDLRKSLKELRSTAPSVGMFRKDAELPVLPERERK